MRWKSQYPVNDIVTWVGFKAIQTAAGGAKETSQVSQQLLNSSEVPHYKVNEYIDVVTTWLLVEMLMLRDSQPKTVTQGLKIGLTMYILIIINRVLDLIS